MKLGALTLFAALLPLGGVAEESGLFVAVGYGGRRISSRDGRVWENDQRWSDMAADDDNVLFNIAFGAGKFVAVGGGAKIGHLLTTRDGREWRELPQVKGRVATIGFGNGRFIAGHDGELLFSRDGEAFTTGERLAWKGSIHARRSACGDTEAGFRTVILGDVDLVVEKKRVSWRGVTGDGTRWEHTALDTPGARDVAYGSGHFVVVGPGGLIESSHDGENWQRIEVGSAQDFSRIVWTGQRFVISGGKLAWSSPDGLTWEPETFRIPCSLAWAREGWLSLGLSWGGNLHTSADLKTWT
ncbi:MAG: hypothetical protein WCF18_01865, partial [Chthoniobacteraceae bacterium]